MFKRQLEAHEQLLIAVREIERDQELDHDGVTAEHLREHPQTKHLTDEQRYLTVKHLEEEGWLRRKPRYFAIEDYRGIWLNDDGRTKATVFKEPRWRPPLLSIGRRAETVVLSVVSAVATVLVVGLIS